jgi:hypothetical protein
MWTGAARLPAEAKEIYDAYLLLKKLGIRPWEINGTGEIYKEDLVYMITIESFADEAARKWDNAESGAVRRSWRV